VTNEEDYELQNERIAKLPKRKQEKFHEALEIERKTAELKRQVHALEQEFMKTTKGFSYTERIMVERHVMLEYLMAPKEEER
jgi:hypothetical protein